MPIRPEMKDKYPANWKEIVALVRQRSGDTCEWCGVGNGAIRRGSTIVLTCAHLDHDPSNCDMDNLRHLCQRCHNEYDAPVRAAGRKHRRLRNRDLFGKEV